MPAISPMERETSHAASDAAGTRRSRSSVDLDDERGCPDCGSDRIVRDPVRGEVVCDACGLVLEETALDEGPEWAAYSIEDSERLAHAGSPRNPLAGASSLTTIIASGTRDARGNPLRLRDQQTYYRLRNLQRRSSYAGPGERSLPAMIRILDRFASVLDLPRPVKDEAAFLCRKAIDRGLLRGRSAEHVVAGCVYAACRIHQVPRTLEELSGATGLPRKTLGRAYRTVRRQIGVSVPTPAPAEYVRRFCSVLGLGRRVEEEALRLVKEFEAAGDSQSLAPAGTTAAAVYLATLSCGEPRSQHEIAVVSGVSEVTLRNRFKAMRRIVPQEGLVTDGRAAGSSSRSSETRGGQPG